MEEQKKSFLQTKLVTTLVVAGFIISALSLAGILGMYVHNVRYVDKIYPGVAIAGEPVGGLTKEEARSRLMQRITEFETEGISIYYKGKTMKVPLSVIPIDGVDIAREVVVFQDAKTVQRAFEHGRKKESVFANAFDQWKMRNSTKDVPLVISMDGAELRDSITAFYEDYHNPAVNARAEFAYGRLLFSDARDGSIIDHDAALTAIVEAGQVLESKTIQLETKPEKAEVTRADLEAMREKIESVLERAPMLIAYDESLNWTLTKDIVLDLISFTKENDVVDMKLSEEAVNVFIDPIASAIYREAEDAEWEILDGRAKTFKIEKNGVELDREVMFEHLSHAIFEGTEGDIPVATKEVEPKISLSELNDLGIVELIATGSTSFAGSPVNRRHNIGVGTAAIDGVIIQPDEIFSTIGTLGHIDASNGYRAELVIKGDRTIPEYGGGLCQVSTTLFRAVMNAGLPIVERRNHSYRVSYYEPPVGMDATIYSPKPDFRFKNDYATPILIQARVVGSSLVYEVYGTKDGREVHITDPVIHSVTAPPPTKFIDTTELEPGKINCVERAHNGASTSFTYSVSYANGETKEEVFESYYRPWQEVCMRGVDPSELEVDDDELEEGESTGEDVQKDGDVL